MTLVFMENYVTWIVHLENTDPNVSMISVMKSTCLRKVFLTALLGSWRLVVTSCALKDLGVRIVRKNVIVKMVRPAMQWIPTVVARMDGPVSRVRFLVPQEHGVLIVSMIALV